MENYIIYNYSTGTIFMRGSGPIGASTLQIAPEGFSILKLCAGINPSVAESDLAYLVPAMWETIKIQRNNVINAGFILPGVGPVDSDDIARSNISGATLAAFMAKAANQPFNVAWTLGDNTTVELDSDGMIALGMAAIGYVNQCHGRARVLREEIAAATTPVELLSINVNEGWNSQV